MLKEEQGKETAVVAPADCGRVLPRKGRVYISPDKQVLQSLLHTFCIQNFTSVSPEFKLFLPLSLILTVLSSLKVTINSRTEKSNSSFTDVQGT